MIERQLTEWLDHQLKVTNKKGYVLGVSGGIDSTLMVKLLLDANIRHKVVHVTGQPSLANEDIAYIRSIDTDNIIEVNISHIVDSYVAMFNSSQIDVIPSQLVNLHARIRESIFYHISYRNDFLVIGTINKAEFNLGYFVKNSSIGDVLPLADLSKKQIRALAENAGIPRHIVFRKASGCNGSEYAEEEWGVSEDEVDIFCENLCASGPNFDLLIKMRTDSDHKRHFPQIFTANSDER